MNDPRLKRRFDKLNSKHAVIMVGGKCLIMNEVIDPQKGRWDINFSTVQDFHNRYRHKVHRVVAKNGNMEYKQLTKLWFESPLRRMYDGVVFDPKTNPKSYYNFYRGLAIQPRKGKWYNFEYHIYEVISNRDWDIYKWIRSWMARIVQEPGGERPGTSIVMRGPQGAGKGCFANIFGELFGAHFLPISNPDHLTGRFNQHLLQCLVAFLDEGFWSGNRRASAAVKQLITQPEIISEGKFRDPIKVANHVNLIIASNNDWVVPAGNQERRFCVLDVSSSRIRDSAYFSEIHKQMKNGGLEAMLYDLMEMDISGADLRKIPKTDALFDQIARSFSLLQRFWFECLTQGQVGRNTLWSSSLPKEEVYGAYCQYCSLKNKGPWDSAYFWKELRKLCKIEDYRPRKGNPKRPPYCKLPSLREVREQFSRHVGMEIPWQDYQ